MLRPSSKTDPSKIPKANVDSAGHQNAARRTLCSLVANVRAVSASSITAVCPPGSIPASSKSCRLTFRPTSGRLSSARSAKLPTLSWWNLKETLIISSSTTSQRETTWSSSPSVKRRTPQESSILFDPLAWRLSSSWAVVTRAIWESMIFQCHVVTLKSSSRKASSSLKITRASLALSFWSSKERHSFQALTRPFRSAALSSTSQSRAFRIKRP